MNKFIIKSFSSVLLVISMNSCTNKSTDEDTENKDNAIIEKLYLEDIENRELDEKTDTVNLERQDNIHREQIFQLLAENKIVTPKDKIRAAWILQHTAAKFCDGKLTSLSPENFLLAYKLSSYALLQLEQQNDTATIRKENIPRIIALNYDRYLLYTYGHQKFGTQFVYDEKTGDMLLAPVDTTLTTDKERKKHNVEPLHLLLKKSKMKPMPMK
ncbi:MAG: hypothetical protein V1775_12995 [Bacteroidota bacterium]